MSNTFGATCTYEQEGNIDFTTNSTGNLYIEVDGKEYKIPSAEAAQLARKLAAWYGVPLAFEGRESC